MRDDHDFADAVVLIALGLVLFHILKWLLR